METPNFRSLAVKQSGSTEAKLCIFGGPGRDGMRKRNFTSLEVLTEKVWKRNLRSLEVLAEQTSDICRSRQGGSAEAGLQIFGSQCRTEVRNGTTHL